MSKFIDLWPKLEEMDTHRQWEIKITRNGITKIYTDDSNEDRSYWGNQDDVKRLAEFLKEDKSVEKIEYKRINF